MAGALRKTMVYLGLAEDDDRYDDDEHRDDVADYDDERRRTPERSERPLAERPETGAAVTSCPVGRHPWRDWSASRRWVR